MSGGLHALLGVLRSQQSVKKGRVDVSVGQVASFVELLFPSTQPFSLNAANGRKEKQRKAPPRRRNYSDYSPGWMDALGLLDLARFADRTTSRNGDRSATTTEAAVAAHILSTGRFPGNPASAEVVAAVLNRWRCLDRPTIGGDDAVSLSTAHRFPPSLTSEAGSRLAYQLSLCDAEKHPLVWAEALALYQRMVEQHTAASQRAPGAAGQPPAAKDMSSVRHTVLVTLLRGGEWEQALRFFRHSLSQRDMPDSVSTGFLVQTLGKAERADEVADIFAFCVRLLRAKAAQLHDGSPELLRLRRQWGTTLSMALATVAATSPNRLEPLLDQLCAPVKARGESTPPLVLLDGNFLAAVQQLSRLEDRQRLLSKARRAGLLDFFKIIRGLLSVGKHREALAVFTECMAASPPLLSRKEVGSSRLSLLSSATYSNMGHVCAALHAACKRDTPRLRLNDAEVEAVLSKSATVPASSRGAAEEQYWDLCLNVTEENYGPFVNGEPAPRRRPSLAMLSFLLRNPKVDWVTALRVVDGLAGGLPTTYAAGQQRHTAASKHSRSRGGASGATEEVLILNAASALLLAQGQLSEATALVARVVQEHNASPSAEFLLGCSDENLRHVLIAVGARVDPRVLFHLLREAPSDLDVANGAFPRPLQILSLLRERECPSLPQWLPSAVQASSSGATRARGTETWLTAVPASVHCETLQLVGRWAADPALRRDLTLAYMRGLALPALGGAGRGNGRADKVNILTTRYCALWEGIITIAGLSLPEESAAAQDERGHGGRCILGDATTAAIGALRSSTLNCGFLPPAHMLLPNQVDRLLPPPSRAEQGTFPSADGHHLFRRCCIAQALVVFSFQVVQERYTVGLPASQSSSDDDASARSSAVEPVVLHGLLKLCCRVGEHAGQLAAEERLHLSQLREEMGCRGVTLSSMAAQLLEWQATHNGADAVSPQSLALLYSLCATHYEANERSEGGCDSDGALLALSTTERLLRPQHSTAEGQDPRSGPGVPPLKRPHTRTCPVNAGHYVTFNKLFGWELGLEMWYRAFPKDVLMRVAGNPDALTYCLSMDDEDDKKRP